MHFSLHLPTIYMINKSCFLKKMTVHSDSLNPCLGIVIIFPVHFDIGIYNFNKMFLPQLLNFCMKTRFITKELFIMLFITTQRNQVILCNTNTINEMAALELLDIFAFILQLDNDGNIITNIDNHNVDCGNIRETSLQINLVQQGGGVSVVDVLVTVKKYLIQSSVPP